MEGKWKDKKEATLALKIGRKFQIAFKKLSTFICYNIYLSRLCC